MRDTLPSGKAEFLSGYDWSWGPVPRSAVHEISEQSLPVCMNWSPISLLGGTTGNG